MTTESRKEFIRDILITAVEGGINYWSQVIKYQPSECLAKILEIDDSGEFTKYHEITKKTITTGINRILKPGSEMNAEFIKEVNYANRINDAGDIDGEMADVIIQVGLFGEVIYG